MNAISLIQAEHRNLGVTLLAFEKLLLDVRDGGREPDWGLFRGVVVYIDSFLYRFHHPKEDEYLFPVLRRRHPPSEPLIRQLQGDHERGNVACKTLGEAISECEAAPADFPRFRNLALEFINNERRHIGTEEAEVLPLAREYLTVDDLTPIENAFSDNDDPMFGEKPTRSYRELSRIIHNVCIYNNPML